MGQLEDGIKYYKKRISMGNPFFIIVSLLAKAYLVLYLAPQSLYPRNENNRVSADVR